MLNLLVSGVFCTATLVAAPTVKDAPSPKHDVKWELSTEFAPAVDDQLLERWEKIAGNAQSPLEQFDVRLAAANWILSRQISAPVSRALLRLEKKGDAEQIAKRVSASMVLLEQAEQAWADVIRSGEFKDAPDALRARNLKALKVFAGAFDSLWPTGESDSTSRDAAMANATSSLSVLLDDDRKEIASAAQLFQGYLYVRREKLGQASDVLPPILKPIDAPRSIALYSRLLQCRILVNDQKAYAASIAILLRLEDGVFDRFHDSRKGMEAQAATAWVRRQLLESWSRQLKSEGELTRVPWCLASIASLDTAYDKGEGSVRVFAMAFAAPEFVDLDKAIARLNERQSGVRVRKATRKDKPKSSDQPSAEGDAEKPADPGS